MFTPHITVACVVQAEGKFLIVEETIRERVLWNQPAGHLEANETLLQAAERELWEETGIRATPQALLKVFEWQALDGTAFIRFTFALDLPNCCATSPQDSDIDRCLWLTAEEIIQANNLRSPLVKESLLSYMTSQRHPLSLLSPMAS